MAKSPINTIRPGADPSPYTLFSITKLDVLQDLLERFGGSVGINIEVKAKPNGSGSMVIPLGYIRAVPAKDAARIVSAMQANLISRMRR